MDGVVIHVDYFARAQTDRMFAVIQARTGGVNQWLHYRAPILDQAESSTVHFGGCGGERPNCLPMTDG